MLFALSDLCWRALALLLLTLAPYAGAVEITPAASAGAASLRLGVVLLALALLVAGLLRLWRASRWGCVLLGVAVVTAFPLASHFSEARGPLARGLVWLAPLVWGALAVLAAGPVADATAQRQGRGRPRAWERAGWALAVTLVAGLGVAASFRRIGSEAAMLRAALRRDRGDEHATLQLARAFERAGDTRQAGEALAACSLANPRACRCAVGAALHGLELGAYAAVAQGFARISPSCREQPEMPGLLAEALAGSGAAEPAREQAEIALARDRNDAHALYALGMLGLRSGDWLGARRELEQAVQAGHGPRARLLLGTLLYQTNELDAARTAFESVLRERPTDVAALYNLALIDQVRGRAEAARAGYARVLELSPRHLDARYNLAILARDAGDRARAELLLREIEQLASPNDGHAPELRRQLGQ